MTKVPDNYIAPEVFDQLERMNLSNIAKKVKAGKVLTAHEQKQLDKLKEQSEKGGGSKKRHIVESMKAAAAILDCPLAWIKKAKKEGCPGFMPGNRIDVEIVREWIARPEFFKDIEDSEFNPAKWKFRFERARSLREEHKLSVSKGEYWPSEHVLTLVNSANRSMLDTLRRYMEQEQPPLLAGKSESEILDENQNFLDHVIEEMKESYLAGWKTVSQDIPEEADNGPVE